MNKSNKAFTLVELLAVIFVIGIISIMTIPTINKVTTQARKELHQSQMMNIQKGVKDWATQNVDILPEGSKRLEHYLK